MGAGGVCEEELCLVRGRMQTDWPQASVEAAWVEEEAGSPVQALGHKGWLQQRSDRKRKIKNLGQAVF